MEKLRVIPHDLAFRGDALARVDEQILFIAGGIPGEEVDVEIVKRDRRFAYAQVRGVIQPSPFRVEPPCPYYGTCGGCVMQHIAYPAQLELKTNLVRDQFRRRGGFEDTPLRPALGMDDPWGYRNHARFSVDNQGHLGFTDRWYHHFMRIDKCLLMHPAINDVLATVQGRAFVKHQLGVRYGVNTGDLLVSPEVPLDDLPFETGGRYFEEAILGQRFRVFASSFFQTNTLQAERIARLVIERLALTGSETVVDAYCGVGTFGILLAGTAGRVIGIEESPSALKDAQHNASGLDNITFVQAKTEDALPALEGPVDALILDPSRKGCHRKVLDAAIALGPDKVVYVSCDPATLARDVRQLVDGGYELIEVQPLDMFPHTFHIECVATCVMRDE